MWTEEKVYLLAETASSVLIFACSVSTSECTQLFIHEKNGRYKQTQFEAKWRRQNIEDQNRVSSSLLTKYLQEL